MLVLTTKLVNEHFVAERHLGSVPDETFQSRNYIVVLTSYVIWKCHNLKSEVTATLALQ